MANLEHLAKWKEGVEAWNKWRLKLRVDADLNDADLRGRDLMGADLKNAKLMRVRLRDSNLRGADLNGANLTGSDLKGADLSDSALNGADLRYTYLIDANLTGAFLFHTVFKATRLMGTRFHGSSFGNTVIADTDLSQAVGLDMAMHHAPSSIGVDTLCKSRGRVPEVFLRGCGLSDNVIKFIPSHFSGNAFEFYSCFISYSHADKLFARRLHDALQGNGIRCWLDEHQLFPGDHMQHSIDEGIRLWDKVLLLCSEKSLTSWWVDKEIQKALMKEEALWKERKKRVLAIIPLNLDGYLFQEHWQDWKRQHLNERLAANFIGWESNHQIFETQFDQILKALRADKGSRETPPESRL